MRVMLARVRLYIERHERLFSAVALFFGFVVDSLTLRRVDLLAENIALVSYIFIAAFCVIILSLKESENNQGKIFLWVAAVAPFVMQIAFGALFSAFVVFYFRSASLSASWPFMLFLVVMLVGNEIFRPYYEKLVFHLSVFFIGILSYSLFLIPVVTRFLNVWTFFASIVFALSLFSLFVLLLSALEPSRVRASRRFIAYSISSITALVLFAYAANIIPPVPLALTDSVVAHSVARSGDLYLLVTEPRTLISHLLLRDTYHRTGDEPVYVWTSVFAPTRLTTPVIHEWQYRQDGEWIAVSRVTFSITGGRGDGYRVYSEKTNLADGSWRVSVETKTGQVIGRVRFDVVSSNTPQYKVTVER